MRPAFIFVDLQQDFFANPALSKSRPAIADGVNDLTQYARSRAFPVIWVRQEFEPDLSNAFLSMRETGTSITVRGTDGCELIPELHCEPTDREVVKHRYSAFFATNLAALMHSLNVTHAVVGGINTHACVRATAVDAYQLDYRVILARDTISSYDEEYHRESLRYLAQSIGVSMNNADIKKALMSSREDR